MQENKFTAHLNKYSNVKHVIGVMSGKGGVGKSSITAQLASALQKQGYRSAILDADMTGPSIPHLFGIKGKARGNGEVISPGVSDSGIQIMSTNMLLDKATDSVIWRGSIIANMVKQFWSDVVWKDVDYMLIDLPPGTGDVPLTVFQSLPIDGIVLVGTPQQLVESIVKKSIHMAKRMDVNILGYVENMSYFICDDCQKKHYIFGEHDTDEIMKTYDISTVARLPLDPKLRELADSGRIEEYKNDGLKGIVDKIKQLEI